MFLLWNMRFVTTDALLQIEEEGLEIQYESLRTSVGWYDPL